VDENRFPVVTQSLTSVPSRRDVLRWLAGAALGLGVARLSDLASPVGAKPRWRTVTRTFSNTAEITLPKATQTVVSAIPYPSSIAVSGLRGTIRDVNVRLNTLTHTWPQDVAVLLVGPGGQTAIVMARVGGRNAISNVTLTLDDEAAEQLPIGNSAPLVPGTFRPTAAVTPIHFNAPAPETVANTTLSVFDGANPNGTWRLFAQDEAGFADPGVFAGGWTLEITTKGKVKKKR
jgi:subtilisin-like proprotein convertase family protein